MTDEQVGESSTHYCRGCTSSYEACIGYRRAGKSCCPDCDHRADIVWLASENRDMAAKATRLRAAVRQTSPTGAARRRGMSDDEWDGTCPNCGHDESFSGDADGNWVCAFCETVAAPQEREQILRRMKSAESRSAQSVGAHAGIEALFQNPTRYLGAYPVYTRDEIVAALGGEE